MENVEKPEIPGIGIHTATLKKREISEESATKTFDEILEYYDIEIDDIVNDQGKEGAETLRNKLIRAIKDGRIETRMSENIEEGFQIIQHTRRGVTVVYNEYNATAAEESDKEKTISGGRYRLLGSLCKKGKDYIMSPKNFNGADLKLAEFISILISL